LKHRLGKLGGVSRLLIAQVRGDFTNFTDRLPLLQLPYILSLIANVVEFDSSTDSDIDSEPWTISKTQKSRLVDLPNIPVNVLFRESFYTPTREQNCVVSSQLILFNYIFQR
jgi:hypothetical protein